MWLLEKIPHSRLSLDHGRNLKKKTIDQGMEYGALLTDLSKAFDCLAHELAIASLHAYDFSIESSNLINDHLLEHKQKVMDGYFI